MNRKEVKIPPTNDEKLLVFARNLLTYAGPKIAGDTPEWPHIPKDALNPIEDAFSAFQSAYNAYHETGSKNDMAAKTSTKEVLRTVLRVFLNDYIRKNSHVTEEDFKNLGMTPPDLVKTVIIVPNIACTGDVRFPGVGLVEVYNIHPLREPTAAERAALHGVAVYYGIMGPPNGKDKFRLTETPLTGDDLPHHEFTTKQSCTLNLQGESGNKLFICLRYENEKAGKGPWGPMIVVSIP